MGPRLAELGVPCHRVGRRTKSRELQVIGYDITDRKRAEESGRQLAHATRFAAVGELTAMVAHEINQPLCAILSNAEAGEIMLRSAEPPLDELREILADIRKDDLRADAAIRSIRSLLQRREFEPRSVDVADTIEHVFKLIGRRCAASARADPPRACSGICPRCSAIVRISNRCW